MARFSKGDNVYYLDTEECTVTEVMDKILPEMQYYQIKNIRTEQYSIASEHELAFVRYNIIIRCECGAEKTVNSNLHASYCPKFY